MQEKVIEYLVHSGQLFLTLFIIGIIVDYPSRIKAKRKKRCDSGSHIFTEWKLDKEIEYINKGVYKRRCKHCKYKEETISRLHPNAPLILKHKYELLRRV